MVVAVADVDRDLDTVVDSDDSAGDVIAVVIEVVLIFFSPLKLCQAKLLWTGARTQLRSAPFCAVQFRRWRKHPPIELIPFQRELLRQHHIKIVKQKVPVSPNNAHRLLLADQVYRIKRQREMR